MSEGWPANPVAEAEDLIAEGKAADAVEKLTVLIEGGRGGMLARLALVKALIAVGRADEAVAAARELTMLSPNWAQACVVLGRALTAKSSLPGAIAEYQRALRQEPDSAEAHLALAEAWTEAGEPDRAQPHLEAAEHGGLDGDALRATLAEMRGAQRSDAGYVRHLFDQFSGDYDQRMRGSLGYRAPEILAELALMVSGGRIAKVATLDLGCGTGLAAPAFRPHATTLTGIDLSPQMIAQAKATGAYDTLVTGDIETWLAETRARFGRIVAADVLVYLGDLAAVFAGAQRVLKKGGQFLFTVERSEGADFVLQETRRWAHSEDYVRRVADAHGFDVAGLMQCTPRFNKGEPIPGLAVALTVL